MVYSADRVTALGMCHPGYMGLAHSIPHLRHSIHPVPIIGRAMTLPLKAFCEGGEARTHVNFIIKWMIPDLNRNVISC